MLTVLMDEKPYFEIVQGEDLVVPIVVVTEKGRPFDLTGYTATARFVSTTGTAVIEAVTVAAGTLGAATLTIVAADSATFKPGERVDWALSLVKTGATRIVDVLRGVTVFQQTV